MGLQHARQPRTAVSSVVTKRSGSYRVHVSMLWKLIVLIAVLLMPLGMQPAASATMGHGHGMGASMPMEHCPDQSKQQHNHGFATCSMACASALPVQQIIRDEAPAPHHDLVRPLAAQTLHGLHPEVPAPPPKRT